jgi:hypothetical protein
MTFCRAAGRGKLAVNGTGDARRHAVHGSTGAAGPVREVSALRTLVILATVAIGAMRLMLRAIGPAQPLESAAEWTADE